MFDDDSRFGLLVPSEIASRALSPAVNDPETAIDVIGRLVRLLVLWNEGAPETSGTPQCNRAEVPEISVWNMLDDAFAAIGRDGATMVEVAALHHGRLALARAESALNLPEDFVAARNAAGAPGA